MDSQGQETGKSARPSLGAVAGSEPGTRRAGAKAARAARLGSRRNQYSLRVRLPGPETSAGFGGCLHSQLGSALSVSVWSLSPARREGGGGAAPGRDAGRSPPRSPAPSAVPGGRCPPPPTHRGAGIPEAGRLNSAACDAGHRPMAEVYHS